MPKNILDIYLDTSSSKSGTYTTNLSKPIPQQTVRVVQVRAQYDIGTDPDNPTEYPLADKFVVFQSPRWCGGNCSNFGKNSSTNTLSDKRGIIIPLQDSLVTLTDSNYYIDLSDEIPQTFDYQLYGLNSNTGLTSVHIKLEYDFGSI